MLHDPRTFTARDSRKPLFYIAGPYSPIIGPDGVGLYTTLQNIAQAQKCVIWCAQHRLHFFCPHTHSSGMEIILPEVPYEYWLELGLRMLAQCTALILLPNWRMSKGAKEEYHYAVSYGYRLFEFPVDSFDIIEYDKESV